MAPILHLLRHGQGYHSSEVNGAEGYKIHDPNLTDKGRAQCEERCRIFTRHEHVRHARKHCCLFCRLTNNNQVDLLLASPLRRALQTCQLCFEPCVKRGLPIIALPHAEEASSDPCDTGSELDVLKSEFPTGVDFSLVPEHWTVHEGEFDTTFEALKARAIKLRRWIRDREEKEVVLVSHGFLNHYVTGDVDEQGKQTTGYVPSCLHAQQPY
jgi:broad specificity phosphatase PhoE